MEANTCAKLSSNTEEEDMYLSLTIFNAELNPICHLLALLGAQPILHVSRVRVNYALRKIVKKKSDF